MKTVATACVAVCGLLLAVCGSGCGGSGVPPVEMDASGMARVRTPLLTRTQGSTEFDQVRCVIEDRRGVVWFGTTGEGVYRYDGEGFRQYTERDGLSSNTVWCMLEDRDGMIWLGTDAGLCRWDGQRFTSVPLPIKRVETDPGASTVWSMAQDRAGVLWLGTGAGVFRCRGEVITPLLPDAAIANPEGLQLKMVGDMLEDAQGNMWFASGMPPGMEGLCRFDGKAVTSLKPGGEQWIRTLKAGPGGVWWLGTRNKGVWQYDGATFSRFRAEAPLGAPMLMDRAGNVWFGWALGAVDMRVRPGVWRYDGSALRSFGTEGLGILEVWCMFQDRRGDIWIGTRNMGLYRLRGTTVERFSAHMAAP